MNHTRFPEEDHLPDWARRDNKVTKADRVDCQWQWLDTKLSAVRMRVETDEYEAWGEGLLKRKTKMVTTNTILHYEDDYAATFAILTQLNF